MILRSCDYVLGGSTISRTIVEKAKSHRCSSSGTYRHIGELFTCANIAGRNAIRSTALALSALSRTLVSERPSQIANRRRWRRWRRRGRRQLARVAPDVCLAWRTYSGINNNPPSRNKGERAGTFTTCSVNLFGSTWIRDCRMAFNVRTHCNIHELIIWDSQ